MKAFNLLQEVNTNTKEGTVLCAAIGKLRELPEYANKNPDEILVEICKMAYPPDGESPGEVKIEGIVIGDAPGIILGNTIGKASDAAGNGAQEPKPQKKTAEKPKK